MANRLDVVVVGIEYERSVVARTVFRTQAGIADVAPARGQRRLMERRNRLGSVRRKRDVGAGGDRVLAALSGGLVDGKLRARPPPKPTSVPPLGSGPSALMMKPNGSSAAA